MSDVIPEIVFDKPCDTGIWQPEDGVWAIVKDGKEVARLTPEIAFEMYVWMEALNTCDVLYLVDRGWENKGTNLVSPYDGKEYRWYHAMNIETASILAKARGES